MEQLKRLEEMLNDLVSYALGESVIDNMVVAVNTGKAEMQTRIFNSESGTRDVNGSGLGGYSNPYAAYRKQKGRQSNVVDLELTGALRRSLKTEIANNSVAIVVEGQTEIKKLGDIERRYKKNIFDASQKEEELIMNTFSELITQDITNILKNA